MKKSSGHLLAPNTMRFEFIEEYRGEFPINLFFYTKVFYNRRRRHLALGYLSPATYVHLFRRRYQYGLTPYPQN
jgi:transposase InsO family protein